MSNVYNYQVPRQILCLVGDSFEGRLPVVQLSRLLPFSSVPLSITFTFPPFSLQKLVKASKPSISTQATVIISQKICHIYIYVIRILIYYCVITLEM